MRPLRQSLLALLLATPVAACTVGDLTGSGGGGDDTGGGGDDIGGGDGPDAAAAPDFTATMSPPTMSTTLGTVSRYEITLESFNYQGPVTLAATGMPASWTSVFEPSTVVLALDGTTTVDLVVTVPTNGDAATAQIAISAEATPGIKAMNSQLVVANQLIVPIPSGTGASAHAFPGRIDLKLGAELRILNSDGTAHQIHSDGGPGFPHQDALMPQGQSYAVTPGDVGSYRFYCHEHGEGDGVTNLVVQ